MSWMLELYLVMVFWEPVDLLEGGSNWHVVTRCGVYDHTWSLVLLHPLMPVLLFYDQHLWQAPVTSHELLRHAFPSWWTETFSPNTTSSFIRLLLGILSNTDDYITRDLRPGTHATCGLRLLSHAPRTILSALDQHRNFLPSGCLRGW